MKKLLTILCLVLLVSCSNEVPSDKLVERQGVTYETNSTKPFTGTSVEYYENGQVEVRINFKDGEKNGLYESYFENGQLKLKHNHKDGKTEGFIEQFYENGQLQLTKNYKNGWEDGPSEDYYENGQLSHDYNKKSMPLITAPITIEENSWISASVFVGPGVIIKKYSVILAGSIVVKDTEEFSVNGGNPSKFIKKRIISDI